MEQPLELARLIAFHVIDDQDDITDPEDVTKVAPELPYRWAGCIGHDVFQASCVDEVTKSSGELRSEVGVIVELRFAIKQYDVVSAALAVISVILRQSV